VKHVKIVQGLLAFLGDLGGVTELIVLLFGFFIYPISRFSFNIKAMENWFMVRTSDNSLFKIGDEEKKNTDELDFDLPK
jgi:hypothetical protein